MTDAPAPAPASSTRHRLVALRIRQQRLKLCLTQAEAAAKSGLPLRTYRRFESSGHGNVDTLYAIAVAFGRAKAIEEIFSLRVEGAGGAGAERWI